MAGQKDERLEAATSHWAMRFVGNGTDYPDFVATLERIDRWEDWCREWGRTAERYEGLAERAEQAAAWALATTRGSETPKVLPLRRIRPPPAAVRFFSQSRSGP